jgi:RNA polymerase sigma-70 factor (ECF subfamily)
VREARPAGAAPARGASSSVDPKHAKLLSAFITASRSGDTATLTRLLASDAKVVTDGGGKAPAALNVIEGADRAASFVVGAVRKGWTDDMSVRFDTINGLPGLIVIGAGGLVQTNAFEIEDGLIKAIYVVRNPDKLRHLASS